MTRAHTTGGKGSGKKPAAKTKTPPAAKAKAQAKDKPKGDGKNKKKGGPPPSASEQLEAAAPMGGGHAAGDEAAKKLIDFPFLKTPAVPGGTIIGTDEQKLERQLTLEDLKSAQEELNNVGKTFRDAQRRGLALAIQEKEEHAQLQATRENIRKAEKDQLEAGSDMATYCEELQTGTRKRTVPVVKTLTPQMEVVFTASDTGEEVDRRTATREEMEAATGKSAQLFGVGNSGGAPPARPAGTTDSPDAKHNPDQEVVTVSVNVEAYKKLPRGIKSALCEQPLPGKVAEGAEPELVSVMWMPQNQTGPTVEKRSYATVPRWMSRQLGVVAEGQKALDFKIEPTPAEPPKPEQQAAQQGLLSTLNQRSSSGTMTPPPASDQPFDDDPPPPRHANG